MAKFAPPSPPFIAARFHGGSQTPHALVIHGTVSSDNAGTARQIANWWHGPTSPVTSAHYVVDPKEIVQCVGDHTVAYHCGYNTGSVSIELCDEEVGPASRWADDDSDAILENAARLAAQLCLAYGIEARRPSVAELKAHGPHGIYGHNDSRLAFGNTTHSDPKDFPWARFLGMVQAEIKSMKGQADGTVSKVPETFKVLQASLHGVDATRKELRAALSREGVTHIAFSEGYKQADFLASRGRWRAQTGSASEKDKRGRTVQQDVVVLVRKNLKHLGGGTRKVCNASTPLKIAPERYMSWSVDEVEGKPLAFISLHPHAMVQTHWDSDRAAEYRKAMRALVALIRRLKKKYGADLEVVVTGDLNYPDVADGRFWAPKQVFERLGMQHKMQHLDWVAWSSGLAKISSKVISREQNGQDHPWIEVELARR